MKIEIEKPIIPQFVADWIERLKSKRDSKHSVLGVAFGISGIIDDRVYDWFVNNKDDFVTAVMYGYDTQNAPLYYAKIKGWELIGDNPDRAYWNVENGALFVSDNDDRVWGVYIVRLTKEEWNELGINDSNADFEKVEG